MYFFTILVENFKSLTLTKKQKGIYHTRLQNFAWQQTVIS